AILVELDDLQFHLGNAAPDLRDGRNDLAALAAEARSLALEQLEPIDLHEVALEQGEDTRELFLDQRDLAFLGCLLGLEPLDLAQRLRDALAKLCLLSLDRQAAGAEKTVFAVDHRCDLRIRLTPRGELRRESDGGEAVALGNQTGDAPRR